MNTNDSFTIGLYKVTPEENSICLADGDKTLVQAKIMEVLVYLASSYPRLVSRSELIDSIWLGNYPVGEKTLTNAIWRLRQILKQDNDSHIETVRKSGYRLLVQPEYSQASQSGLSFEDSENSKTTSTTSKRQVNWLFPVVVLLTLMFGYLLTKGSDKKEVIIDNLTADPGRELFPNVSPDGNKLAYIWRHMDSETDIYLKDLTQPSLFPKQLTFNDDRESSPLWSKDGLHLYFSSRARDKSYCYVMQLNIVTTEQKSLANCTAKPSAELALSSDGNTLAFTGHDKDATQSGIYFLDLTDEDAKPLRFSCDSNCKYQDRNFAFSPDNKSLAVTRRVEKLVENIFLVNISDKTSRQLTFGPGDIKGLTWHQEGEKIIYSSANSGRREGYAVNIKTGDIVSLNLPGFSYPSYVPDTNDLVYHQWQVRSYLSQLSLSDTSVASSFPVLQSKFDYHSADFSSVNEKIVYISNESGNNEVWTSDTQGQQRQQVTYLHSQLSYPRWSHDGKKIVFLAAKHTSLGNDIYIIDVATQRINKLASNFSAHFRPSWSIDDQAIIVITSKEQKRKLIQISLESDTVEVLLEKFVRQAVQDHNKNIWFTTNKKDGLWLYQPQSQNDKFKQVLTDELFNADYNWTVTNKGVFYQFDEKEHHNIMFFQFENNQTTTLLKLPLRTLDKYSSMTYQAEQNKLIFTQTEFPQVDIKRLSNMVIP